MTEPRGPDAKPADKLLASASVRLRLALISGLVLVAGALLAPRAAPTALPAPLTVPQERAAPLLEEQVQRRETPPPFRGVQEIALRVRQHGAAILPARQPARTFSDFGGSRQPEQAAGFGVFVSDTYVLTHANALDGRSSVQVSTVDGGRLDARIASFEPATGLVLLATMPSGIAAPTLASALPDPGSLAAAVGRRDGRDVAMPVFITSVEGARVWVGGVDDSARAGMPLYTMDGELFAITAGRGRAGMALAVRDAAGRLIARASAGERPASVGIAFQDLTGALADVFGSSGALVTAVVEGGPAGEAGIEPGDVLVAIGDAAVDSAAAAVGALGSSSIGTTIALRLRREGRDLSLSVTPAGSYEVAARAASRVAETAPQAAALFPAADLERAAIPPSARVLSVNGRPVASRAQLERELRRARGAVPVLLREDDTQFFAAIEPTR